MNSTQFKSSFPQGMSALFTDTSADFILPPEAKGLSPEQRKYLSDTLKIDPQEVFTMRQVHGNNVLTITAKDIPQQGPIPDADAMVTNVPGIVITMRTADCLPVFLYDSKKRAIAVVHAGWKGTEQKISIKAVETLVKNYDSRPEDIHAVFGPAIRECCYKVGEEFKKAFPGEVKEREGKLCYNMPLANHKQLLSAGLKGEHIVDTGDCTVCGIGFYSFRRDQDRSGRHLSILQLL